MMPNHKRDYSADYATNNKSANAQVVPKSKTEVLQAAFHNKAGLSNNVNLRVVDSNWLNSFHIVKSLDKEIFSELYLIKMGNGQERVMRKVKKVVFKEPTQGIEDYRFFLEELLQLEHPNITQLYDYKEDQYNFYLVLEYCKGGTLFAKIADLSEMTENLAAEICRQILSTIVYLHSKSYLYRNLSPDVLLLEAGDTSIVDGFNLKLVNIDLQSALSEGGFYSTPLVFQAPEVLGGKVISEKQDVWACGVLLTVLLTGETPFEQAKDKHMVEVDFELANWREVSGNAVELVRKLLDTDPEKRIKAVTALNDKWLLNITRKRNNQKKILNHRVMQNLKKLIYELKLQ